MIEQLIGEWSCGLDRVSFELVEGELVVRAWKGAQDFILSAATRGGVWAYLVPSNDCRVHQEVVSIGPNEFTARWFNSDGFKGEITYRRAKPTPPISIEGRQGHAYAAGVKAERARLATALDDGSSLALRLASFMPAFSHNWCSAVPMDEELVLTRALDELLTIIRSELEVQDAK